MDSNNKLSPAATIVGIYLVLGGFIAFVNLVFDLPYSKWLNNNMPAWLAGGVLAISSLCFVIGAIPPKKRTIISNLLLSIFFVTTFLIIKPSYKLAPEYMRTILQISLLFYGVVKIFLRKSKRKISTPI